MRAYAKIIRKVQKILLCSFGTFASVTFYDSEESDSACLEAMLRIFFKLLYALNKPKGLLFFLKTVSSSTYERRL